MRKKEQFLDTLDTNIQKALEDLNDFEVQAIKEKYSKRTFNPFKNKKNKQLLVEEVSALLEKRELERKREEKRIEMEQRKEALLDTIEKTKAHVGNNSRFYTILISIVVLIIAGLSLFNRYQSTVRGVNFTFSDEEKFIDDYIDTSYSVEPNTAKYEDSEITIVFSNDNLIELDANTNRYICTKEGDLIVKLLYKGKEYDSKTIKIKPILISKLYLPDIQVGKGNTVSVEPTIEPDNATNKNYIMTIEDTSIATLKDNVITGVSKGKTVLHLQSEDGFSYDVPIDVIDIEPTSISIRGLRDKYIVGDEAEITVEYSPEETTIRQVSWKSSDESILTVDTNGKLTAVEKGTVTITAFYNESVTAKKEVTVNYPYPSSIAIAETNTSLTVGDTVQLAATISPEKVSNDTISWTSSDTNIAEIDENGSLLAKSAGEVTVTAKTTNGKTSTLSLVVEAAQEIATSEAAYTAEITRSSSYDNTSSGITVWIPQSGSKYHAKPSCSRMKYPSQVSLEEAKKRGYEPCSKCNP